MRIMIWSNNKDFTLNLTQFDRKQLHPEVNMLVVVYRLLYEELLCRLHCIIYEFLTGISYVVLNDLYNNVGLLTSDPTTLLLPKSIAVVEENVS